MRVFLRTIFNSPDIGRGAILLFINTEEKTITTQLGLAGENEEFKQLTLDLSHSEFLDILQKIRFNSQFNPSNSSDLERLLQKNTSNINHLDQIIEQIKRGNQKELEYMFQQEIEVALHTHLSSIKLACSEFDPGQDENQESLDDIDTAPFTFCLSPLQGTPLKDLKPGVKVMVRPEFEPELAPVEPQPENESGAEVKSSKEIIVTIKAINSHPTGGRLVNVIFPDSREELIYEEEPLIRVKLYQPEAATTTEKSEAASSPEPGSVESRLKGFSNYNQKRENLKQTILISAGIVLVIIMLVIAYQL